MLDPFAGGSGNRKSVGAMGAAHVAQRVRLGPAERETYRRYAPLALPRHTSYPTVPFWKPQGPDEYRSALVAEVPPSGWSLYVHIPFCDQLCYFCSCTREILPRSGGRDWRGRVRAFLRALRSELDHVAALVMTELPVAQLHLGGGTPNYVPPEDLVELVASLEDRFQIAAGAERSVELDPRTCTHEHLHALRTLGFNRVSLGIQDFDPQVQALVNRIQPIERVAELVGAVRQLGFESINFDLIYGLPGQSLASFQRTLEATIALRPDRIALYRLAVLPDMFRWQRVFKASDLPEGEVLMEMFLLAVEMFAAAGYEYVGLDHFALPEDSLCRAQRSRRLRRTFQGITTGKDLSVVGLGPSAISILHASYHQNHKNLDAWLEAIERERLATFRGLGLSWDDLIRREVIEALYCYGAIDLERLGRRHGIDAVEYFASELKRLELLERDGLVEVDEGLKVRLRFPLGRLLTRVVAAVFDRYLPEEAYRTGLQELPASRVG